MNVLGDLPPSTDQLLNDMKFLKLLARFFIVKRTRYLFFLILIGLIALIEYRAFGVVRRTFVYYSVLEGATMVEDRMFHASDSKEVNIRRYIEEVLLGPVSPDAALLFPRDTRLLSVIYRDGSVYADFSEHSIFPDTSPEEGVFLAFLTLNEGIRRNFSYVKNVNLYIGGNQIFFNEFHVIFADSADNTNKTGQKALTY